MTFSAANIGHIGAHAGNPTIPLTADAAVGDVVIVSAIVNSTVSSWAVTDTQGNTYTTALTSASLSSAPTNWVVTSYAVITTALTTSDTITVTMNVGAQGRQAIVVDRLRGVTASPLDKSATANSSSSSNQVSAGATGTRAQADEVIHFGAGAGVGASVTLMSGYTPLGTDISDGGSNERRMSTLYKVVSATTTETPTATIGASTSWGALLTTWKIAASTSTGAQGDTLRESLNRLGGTTDRPLTFAANAYAGTTGLPLVAALNAKNGTTGLPLAKVLNALAGTSGLAPVDAAWRIEA